MQTRRQGPVTNTSLDSDSMEDPLLGTVLEDRYRLDAILGEGGMGVVYLAQHLKLSRSVAIKVLHADMASNVLLQRRFEREAKTLAAMSHPHIVSVTDYGITAEAPYLVMEFVEGETLEACLDREERLRPTRAIAIVEQLLQALAYAHGQGLIHRDLKPANIAVQDVQGKGDHVRVLDFGLAKFLVPEGNSTSSVVLTRTGAVMGTPAYMAPEQSVGGETDARTDVYAVGVILYEMLTGQRPFEGETSDLLRQALLEPVPSIVSVRSELGNLRELDQLIQKATAKDPGDRFEHGGAMLNALKKVSRESISPVGDAFVSRDVSANVERRRKSAMSPPSTRGLSFAAVATLVGLAILLYFLSADESNQAATGTTTDEVDRSAEPKVDVPIDMLGESKGVQRRFQGTTESTGAWVDPWQAPAPKLLREVRRALDRGQRINERNYKPLRRAGLRSKDGRAFVLLGRAYMQRGWRSDALDAFEQAVEIQPEVRADEALLGSLVELMEERSSRASAASAIRSIYGVDAIAAVQTAVGRPGLDSATKRGYAELLADIQQ